MEESLMDDPEDSHEDETDEEREFWKHVRDVEIEESMGDLIEPHPDYL
jgi:hypothetical protein